MSEGIMYDNSSNSGQQTTLGELRHYFSGASLVHVSIDFQEKYLSCSNRQNISQAAWKTAALSGEFARMGLPNWWVYYQSKTGANDDFYAVAPAADDVVIPKTAMSAFAGSSIEEQLQRASIKALLISGISRDACVYRTVQDACQRGYKVFLIEDCITSSVEDNDDMANWYLEHMRQKGAVITSSAEILQVLMPTPCQ
jgi:nicotinamidase-related amidase